MKKILVFVISFFAIFGGIGFCQAQTVTLDSVNSACNGNQAKVNLAWHKHNLSNADYFVLRRLRGEPVSAETEIAGPLSGFFYVDITAISDKEYTYRIKAVKNLNTYYSENELSNIPAAYCPPTMNPSSGACQSDGPRVNLSWEGISGNFLRYDVYRNGAKIGSSLAPNFTDGPELTGGQIYNYSVKAFWQDTNSATSLELPVVVLACPVVLNALNVSCLDGTPGGPNIGLTWNTLNGVSSFEVKRSTSLSSGVFSTFSSVANNFSDDLSQTLTDDYWKNISVNYKINTIFSSGNQAESSVQSIAVPQCKPFLSVSASCNDSTPEMNLFWTGTKGAGQYNIYWESGWSDQVSTLFFEDFLSEAECPGGICSHTYYIDPITVESVPNSNSVLKSVDCITILPPSPDPALSPVAIRCESGAPVFDFSWTSSDNTTYYGLYKNGVSIPVAGGTISYSDYSLVSGNVYNYYVIAYGRNGVTSGSSAVQTATAPNCYPPSPDNFGLNLTASCQTGDPYIDLSWNQTLNTERYKIYRGTSSGNYVATPIATFEKGSPGYISRIFRDNYVPAGAYYYKIVAEGIEGLSPVSSVERSGTTTACDPAVPVISVSTSCFNFNSKVTITRTSAFNINTFEYELWRRRFDGTSWLGWENIQDSLLPTQSIFTDSFVGQEVNYQYQLKAIGFKGQVQSSSVGSGYITTLYCQVPDDFTLNPTVFSCKNNHYVQTSNSWTNSLHSVSYDLVERRLNSLDAVLETVTFIGVSSPVVETGMGKALKFTKVLGTYVGVADSPVFDTGSAISVEAWVKTTGNCSFASVALHNISDVKWRLGCDGNSKAGFNFYVKLTNGLAYATPLSANLNDGKWHHVVGVFDKAVASRLKLYVDGVLSQQAVAANFNIMDGDEGVHFGSFQMLIPNSASNFPGYIDEIRVYNRALSLAEITQHYSGSFTAEETQPATFPPPIGLWHFDEGSGQIATDSSNNLNNGILGISAGDAGYDPEWVNNGLQIDYKYDWQAQAKNAAGSVFSNRSVATFLPACQPIKPGLQLSTTCVFGKPQVSLQWSFSLNASKFNIYRSVGGIENLIQTINNPNTLSFLDDNSGIGLAISTAYSYRVEAESSNGLKKSSSQLTITTNSCLEINPPGNLVANFTCFDYTSSGTNSYPRIILSWDPAPNAVYYQVFKNGIALCNSQATCPNGAIFQDSYPNVAVSTAYSYYIITFGPGNVASVPSATVNITSGNYCEPSKPNILSLETGCLSGTPFNDLVWSDDTVFNTTAYLIFRDEVLINTITQLSDPSAFNNRQWRDATGLVSNHNNYNYKVRASGLGGVKTSNQKSIDTLSCGVAITAPNLSLNNLACQDNANVSSLIWNNVSNAYSYNLRRQNPDGSYSTFSTVKSLFQDKGDFALNFNGTNSYIDFGNQDEFKITGDLSIELWLKPANFTNGTRALFCKDPAKEFCLYVYIDSVANIYGLVLSHGNGSTSFSIQATNFFQPISTDYIHIVVTRDIATRTIKFYKNGVFFSSDIWTALADPVSGASNLFVASSNGSSNMYAGVLDDIRLYSRVLTQGEAQDRYAGNYKNETGLVGVWHLDEGSGNIVNDSSLNNHSGNLMNNPQWQTPQDKPRYISHVLSGQDYKYQVKAIGVDTESVFSSPAVSLTGLSCLSVALSIADSCAYYNQPITILSWENKGSVASYSITKNGSNIQYVAPLAFMSQTGYLKHWLIAGTYSNAGDLGWSQDTFINNEATANPRNNLLVEGKIWKDYTATSTDEVDFYAVFPSSFNVLAYAFTYVYSPVAIPNVKLKIDYTDGVKIYFNGANVYNDHTHSASSVYKFGEVIVNLNQGVNKLLVKLDQGAGTWWRFRVRITDNSNNNVLTNLTWWDSQIANGAGAASYVLTTTVAGESASSVAVFSNPSNCLPVKPANLVLTPQCQGSDPQMKIEWDSDSTGLTSSYSVMKVGYATPVEQLFPPFAVRLSTLDSSVDSGDIYSYYVLAIGKSGYSTFSDGVSGEADFCYLTPDTPVISSVEPKCAGIDSRLKVSWGFTANTIAFNVLRKEATEPSFTPLSGALNLPITKLDYTDSVVFGTSYQYQVQAVGGGTDNNKISGSSVPVSPIDCTNAPPLMPVLSIDGSPIATAFSDPASPTFENSPVMASVAIKWTSSGNATTYNLFKRPAGTSIWSLLYTLDCTPIPAPACCLAGDCHYLDNGSVQPLNENTTYDYQVQAINSFKLDGVYSGIPQATVPIAGPGEFYLTTERNNFQVKLIWSVPPTSAFGGLAGYTFSRGSGVACDPSDPTDCDFASPVVVNCAGVVCGNPCVIGGISFGKCCECLDVSPIFKEKFYRVNAANLGGNSVSDIFQMQIPVPQYKEGRP